CLVVGDRLHFYVSGRTSGENSVALAFLRRDGFAWMDAGVQEGTLTTRPARFSGRRLFVNVDNPKGALRVEVLDEAGQVIAPFTAEACVPVAADQTAHRLRWKSVADLSSLANQPVRFRFHLRNGHLYAFWVSPDASGASRGYVTAGGPGFTENRDLVGSTGRN
ncbi:glycosyl hydrolase family 32, partial [Candidatus Sumerlaeota bacterium]|nr:glycosyl hydrolase family 32 [Candidatus Sumerlaeota bacterium]